jgi:hypothetical protein
VGLAWSALGLGSVLLGVVSSPAVAATGSWSTPVDLSAAGGNAQGPQISVDAAGNAIAVWQRGDGSNDTVQTSSSTDGGVTWSTAEDLSAAGVIAQNPQISVDSTGTAIAVWNGWNAGTDVVQSASSTDGGLTWTIPEDIYSAGGTAFNPQISVDAAGTAYAVWYRWNGSNDIVQSATSTDGGLTWTAPEDLSTAGGTAVGPQISVDAAGTAVAVWRRNIGSNFIVQSRSSSNGGATWSTPTEDLSADISDAYGPQISAYGAGSAIAVWEGGGTIQSAWSGDGGVSWSIPEDLSAADGYAEDPQIIVNAAGSAVAIWRRDDDINNNVQSAWSSDGGVTWSTPVDLSVTNGGSPQITVDSAGNVFAIWRSSNNGDRTIQSATSTDGGLAWTAPVDLSAPGSDGANPQISVDAKGNVFAIWRRYDGNDNIVQVSSLTLPTLADTGASSGTATTTLGVGAGLLAAGALALVLLRRRLARS